MDFFEALLVADVTHVSNAGQGASTRPEASGLALSDAKAFLFASVALHPHLLNMLCVPLSVTGPAPYAE